MIKNHIIYNKFSNYRFNLAKAKGEYLWDDKGNKYIDFTSGWNVCNLGWDHPEITQAILSQAKQLTYSSMWTTTEIQQSFAQLLTSKLPSELDTISRVNAGAEANEHAIKIARAYTNRKKILGFYESYHGANLTAMSLSHYPDWTPKIISNREDYTQMTYPNTYRTKLDEKNLLNQFTQELEDKLKQEDIAAVLTESGIITGWGSTYVAPQGFISSIRKLTKKYGTLLILDEVGTGFSRTGKLFGMEHERIIPDIVTFAKGISNGALPIGAVVTTHEIAEQSYPYAQLQSTFGWNPIACAAAKKTLEIHLRDKVWEMAESKGLYLRETLRQQLLNNPFVGDIRGMGMETGVDFVKNKKTKDKYPSLIEKIVAQAELQGLHLVHDFDSNIQIMPPLTINSQALDSGIETFVKTVNNFT